MSVSGARLSQNCQPLKQKWLTNEAAWDIIVNCDE